MGHARGIRAHTLPANQSSQDSHHICKRVDKSDEGISGTRNIGAVRASSKRSYIRNTAIELPRLIGSATRPINGCVRLIDACFSLCITD